MNTPAPLSSSLNVRPESHFDGGRRIQSGYHQPGHQQQQQRAVNLDGQTTVHPESSFAFDRMTIPQLKSFEGLLFMKVASDKEVNVKAFTDETFDASLNWKDIFWLRSITKLPILVKGILTAEDAIKALEVGVDGIIVSNHGARDYSPATISVLEEIVHAVKGAVPVFMDGGVRRGTNIFKALALGAQAALIGRPVIYGLAARGEGGVRTVIEMLKIELKLTMALSGCPAVKDITRRHVTTERDRLQSKI
ncbi:hypothetical protein MLD38_029508 [Melastoma candidum]|uniref:Uncharacterized protein n=1 Tax=Melastoma candidum TaxID=119954 RepID=A0ACB9N4C6_9MYRT|nr:hypothetical protein MLD38_029508 [Melastoma candidum]